MLHRRSRDPDHTRALVVLPKWPSFAKATEGLTLYREFAARRQLFTRSPADNGSQRQTVAPAPWPVCLWLMDKRTPVSDTVGPAADAADGPQMN